MEPIGPGSHDRAWNDPPKFAFNASGAAGGPSERRRLMNKRVPIPIGSSGNAGASSHLKPSDTPPKDGHLPRMMSPLGPPPTISPAISKLSKTETSEQKEDALIGENLDSEEMLLEVMTSLDASIGEVSEKKKIVLDDSTKRVETMRKMWTDGELEPVVQRRMLLLVRAMKEGNYNAAMSIHQGLMVDFTSMCSTWMVGVKHIIKALQALEIDADPEGADACVSSTDNKEIKEPLQGVTKDVKNIKLASESPTEECDNSVSSSTEKTSEEN